MKIHFIDIHPDPARNDPARPHVKRAFDERRVSLCGDSFAAEALTTDLANVTCGACRSRAEMLRRHADDSITHRLLAEIKSELEAFEEGYGTLGEHIQEAATNQLADELIRVYLAHRSVDGSA